MKKFQNIKNIKTISKFLMGFAVVSSGIASNFIDNIFANDDFRGAWIATVYNSDFPTIQNDIEGQKQEYRDKLDKLQAMGLNSVVVQVRPKGDAYYKSELNPWSSTINGGLQGVDPQYDVMQFMIEETHSRGMEFHAWLNPYRVTTYGTDFSTLSEDNMARKNQNWTIIHNNAIYYNPALSEVKQYIADTVAEIVENYDVDGIHFDDYFYPSNYPLSSGELPNGEEANARRSHVNDMIRMVYNTIKEINSDVVFGVSPQGVWQNVYNDERGSNTKGGESYHQVFADSMYWVDEGIIDYIAPQIYWETGHSHADYETLVSWWATQVLHTDVDLYIGQGLYKDVVASQITTQLNINDAYNVEGSIYFSAVDLFNNREGCATAVTEYYTVTKPTVSANKLPVIQVPSTDNDSDVDTNTTEDENILDDTVADEDIVDDTTEDENTETELDTEEDKAENTEENSTEKLATVTTLPIFVNGVEQNFQTYTIDYYTYFKLRDIAKTLTDTPKRFDTIWDNDTQTIHLLTDTAYTGDDSHHTDTPIESVIGKPSTARLMLDDDYVSVSAYKMNDYNYYKLRDLATLLDFGVTWNSEDDTISIDTDTGYVE